MFSCAGTARRAPARSISVARVARDSRETTSHDSNVESPAAVALPIPPPIPIASQSSRAVGRTRGRSDTRPDPTSTARARASPLPAHENNVRSPRFLLRRPRRRLQGDQGPSAYSVFFRRSTVVVVPRETRREGRRERASAREGRYDRRARWSCDGRRGTMRSGRARGDDERKGFGNIVSAHRLLGRVIARDDRFARARARARDRTIAVG